MTFSHMLRPSSDLSCCSEAEQRDESTFDKKPQRIVVSVRREERIFSALLSFP